MKTNSYWNKYMTEEMLACVLSEEELLKEIEYCHSKFLEANKVNTKLPQKTKNGESVLFGACLKIHDIAYYWEVRRDLAKRWLNNSPEAEKWLQEKGIRAGHFKC